ncbi:hypothetical protein Hsc_1918 [Herbaspirillum seropedicae]|nr:hypothetical protein Hsc_1918 [Herbaspirillum seropedicae]
MLVAGGLCAAVLGRNAGCESCQTFILMIQTILFRFQVRYPIATAVQTGLAQGRCVLVSRPLCGPGKRHDRLYCQPLQRF